MKRVLTAVAVATGCALYFWLAGAFIAQEFNPMHWSYAGRGVFVTCFLPATIIVGVFTWAGMGR